MKTGDRVRVREIPGTDVTGGRTGVIVACTTDGPWDWWVRLAGLGNLTFLESELELIGHDPS